MAFRTSRLLSVLLGLAVMAGAPAAAWLKWGQTAAPPNAAAQPTAAATPGIPVIAGVAQREDVPIFLSGLGTVQALNTVLVRARVDGQLDRVLFTEGQTVKEGDVLGHIDPRPFEALLAQAQAAKAR